MNAIRSLILTSIRSRSDRNTIIIPSLHKSYAAIWFSDLYFLLAFCSCFLDECRRLQVVLDLRYGNNGGNSFPVDKCVAYRNDATNRLWIATWVDSLDFPIYFLPSKVIQHVHACAEIIFFSVLRGNVILNLFSCFRHPRKALHLRDLCWMSHQVSNCDPTVRPVARNKNKKKLSSGNYTSQVPTDGEQSPLNRLLIFLAH
jgi:hypothetical protein